MYLRLETDAKSGHGGLNESSTTAYWLRKGYRDLFRQERGLKQWTGMPTVQIFGVKGSQATRAAERFFKERRIAIQFVDLAQRPMAPAELKRFVDRFGLTDLIDRDGKPYDAAGLKYMKLSDSEWIARIGRDPKLLRLPLIRSGNRLSIGPNEDAWKEMLA